MTEITTRTPMELAIEELKAALANVKDPGFVTLTIRVIRFIGGRFETEFGAYSTDCGSHFASTIEAAISQLNKVNPAGEKLKQAAELDARAARLRREAAELEGK